MIYIICCLVFTAVDATANISTTSAKVTTTSVTASTTSTVVSTTSTIAGNDSTTLINETRIDDFGSHIFDGYNEVAETFQTGVLVRLDDNDFHFGNFTNPLGLSCTEGYTRPVVLNVVRSTLESNIYQTQVILKNMSIFYKDCRVTEESEIFLSAPLRTPCFLTIGISALISWARVSSIKQMHGSCQNSIDLDLDNDITGSGTVRLFFLRSSTLYTFPFFLNYDWSKKIQEAVSRTSRLLLYDYVECLDLPVVNQTSKFQTAPNRTANNTDGYDYKTLPVDGSDYYDHYEDHDHRNVSSTTPLESRKETVSSTVSSITSNNHITTITSKLSTTHNYPY